MASGVELTSLKVSTMDGEHITLDIQLVITAENEFDAVGWLVDVIGKAV